jgi:RNA polymerase sigma-70 factor (ECF subfamily)
VDPDLVAQAREGDREAFEEIVAQSLQRLNAVARLILRDPEAADDAVQDALVDAWVDLRALRDPERFDAWLNRLLVRACYDVARRDRGRRAIELPLALGRAPVIGDIQHLTAVGDAVQRGLRRLPLDQRVVVVLAFYLDLPLAAIAATLGVPLGTVKSRLNRALHGLRAAVEADERPSESKGIA